MFRRFSSSSVVVPASRSGIILFSGLTAMTTALGVWQIQRFFWKRDLLLVRASSMSAPAVDLSRTKTSARAYVHATISGAIPDTAKAALLEPRVAPPNMPPSLAARQVANGGRCLIVPLRRADGTSILALIGWLPSDANVDAALDAFAARFAGVDHKHVVSGVVRESEDPGRFKAEHKQRGGGMATTTTMSQKPSFSFIDVPAVAAACGFDAERGDEMSFLVEVIYPPLAADARMPWPVTRNDAAFTETTTPPSTHAIYAGTWLTLAAYGLAATLQRVRGGRGRGGERRLK